jgi:hypothetical protein
MIFERRAFGRGAETARRTERFKACWRTPEENLPVIPRGTRTPISALEHVAFESNHVGRHCEQSEAIQT